MALLLRVAPLLLLSGGCALIYQTVWFRELRLIFGSSTFASAAVLAIYMGGLGLGAALFGRRADKHPRPLAMYGVLEIVAAVAAALSPLLAALVRSAYVAAGGLSGLGTVGASIVRLLLAVLILAIPTIAMGGTLPAAARAVLDPSDSRRRNLALLYGVNTLGAVIGTLLATFALIETLGSRGTLWAAAALNAVVGVVAIIVARRQPAIAEDAPAERPEAGAIPRERFILAATAIAGFVFFAMELVWYRMLAPLLGGSTFSFGAILAVALAGIGLGGAAYAFVGRDKPATFQGLALTCALEALFLAAPFALGDRIALFGHALQSLRMFGFAGSVSAWMVISAIVVFLPAFVAGIQFPLLIALLGRGRASAGRQVGVAYAMSTVGSILGSLIAGFILLPLVGAVISWKLLVAALVALSIAAAFVQVRRFDARLMAVPAAVGALAIAFLFAQGPTAMWRHSGIGAGRARVTQNPNDTRDAVNLNRRALVWETDGRESSVALVSVDDIAFVVNGKTDGTALADAATQVMSGLLGALLHPDAKTAMVIGLGTGSTAGWLAAVPTMDRVDVVELEPAIVGLSEIYAPINHRVLENPKVKIAVEDAREVLLTRRDTYDLIFSEPSNPYRAGIASLFTREFYAGVKKRMAKDALFIQWMQAYEVDARTVQAVVRTLQAEFQQVELWHTNGGDLLLVARVEPGAYSVDRVRTLARSTPFKEALAFAWGVSDAEGVFSRFVANDAFLKGLTAGHDELVNTDDKNFVEFSFARSVGDQRGFFVPSVWEMAQAVRMDLPTIEGTLNLESTEIARARSFKSLGVARPALPPAAAQLVDIAGLSDAGNIEGAYALVTQNARLRHPRDLVVAAHVLATKGDVQARTLAERIAHFDKGGAKIIEAMLQTQQSAIGTATDLLVEAFTIHRTDPWTSRLLLVDAMNLAVTIATADKPLGRRLYDAVAEDFSMNHVRDSRLQLRVQLAMMVDPKALCVEALRPFEPHVKWERGFLSSRADCYEQTGHVLAAAAREDLADFEVEMARAITDLVGLHPVAPPPATPPVAAETP